MIETGVRHNHRRVYRLIGRDLYSAPMDKPLKEQEYKLEKTGVVDGDQAGATWRVVVREGGVYLDKVENPRQSDGPPREGLSTDTFTSTKQKPK